MVVAGKSATLDSVADDLAEVVHRIVWSTVSTTDRLGRPRTRITHPVWEIRASPRGTCGRTGFKSSAAPMWTAFSTTDILNSKVT
ncbi:hypothetical protein H4W33_000245 [Kibdelosporangium phytohabitans]|nr:hypothetical protein [Kibdelosporangium phytohabitans]